MLTPPPLFAAKPEEREDPLAHGSAGRLAETCGRWLQAQFRRRFAAPVALWVQQQTRTLKLQDNRLL